MKTPHTMRARWAAVGAAVAVAVGAGGAWVTHAASPPSSVVLIEPARVLDTRDGIDLGLPGPFVSPVSQDLRVTGEIPTATGDMIVVPEGATGVLLNVTPVGAEAGGFISVRPAEAAGDPTTSNVNFTAGQTNPNSVQVEVPITGPGTGEIEITYNAFEVAGPTTDILVDIVGYTLASGFDDELLEQFEELQEKVAALENSQPFSKTDNSVASVVGTDDEIVASVEMVVPATGSVTVVSSANTGEPTADDEVRCSITTGSAIEFGHVQRWESGGAGDGQHGQLAGVRLYSPLLAGTYTFNLVCDHAGAGSADSRLESIALVATFNPAE